MAGILGLVGVIAGAFVGYTVTKDQSLGWQAVGVGAGVIGGALVGNTADNATGI